VCVLAVVAWRVMGATLRPVEALRRGAEEITGADLAGRLPVPAGRDEIHRLAVTLNSMLRRLEAGRLRQREFVADAAHELRSPLANMRAQLEVAQRLGPAAVWPEVAADLLADTRRLARLVDDLLVLARAEAGAGPPRSEPVELGAVVADVASRYPLASVAAPDGEAWVDGDPEALGRVVANLLDNAARYASSAVCVALAPGGPTHVITIADDGPGVPAAARDRVFQRFTRLDEARGREDGGAGLGLAIVRELVRQHRGEVVLGEAAGSASSPGLRVQVYLPARSGPRVQP
jgi:signal transduction histidine kinase